MIVDVLGAKWKIVDRSPDKDELLVERYGYCDTSVRLIVLRTEQEDDELLDYAETRKSVIRHELIHALMYESGLHDNMTHPEIGVDETMVDWVAIQFPKMLDLFKKAGCL